MNGPHVVFDHLLIAVSVLASICEWLWLYPRHVRAIAAGAPGARARLYRDILLQEWGFVACVLALWLARGRTFESLGLGSSTPLRLGIGFAVAAAFLAQQWVQRRTILARPRLLERVAKTLASADPLVPRTPAERRRFMAVSITAGVCEEIFYRGFALWYVAVWTGPVAALLASSLLFGLAHTYLGYSHILRTAIVGLLFGLVVLASGSLWPAIVIHAAMDLFAGDLGWRARAALPAGAGPTPLVAS